MAVLQVSSLSFLRNGRIDTCFWGLFCFVLFLISYKGILGKKTTDVLGLVTRAQCEYFNPWSLIYKLKWVRLKASYWSHTLQSLLEVNPLVDMGSWVSGSQRALLCFPRWLCPPGIGFLLWHGQGTVEFPFYDLWEFQEACESLELITKNGCGI